MSEVTATDSAEVTARTHPRAGRSLRQKLSFRNIGAVYVWIGIIVLFSIWVPEFFLTARTFHAITNQFSIAAILTLALVPPLAAGVFDLSVGAVMGLAGVVAGMLLGTGAPVWLAVVLALLTGSLVGLLNALVLYLGIDSFIGTLATGSMIGAVTIAVSNQRIMTDGLSGTFASIATTEVFAGIQITFVYVIVLATLMSIVLTRTVVGRRLYATGFNPVASRLAGVSVDRVRTLSLVASGTLAAFAGVCLAARVEAADPVAGPAYLIPAFSAAFLGATQFGGHRFNAWGAVIAVFMIGTGSYGLLLAGSPVWAPQLFAGAVLLFAVGATVAGTRRGRG